MNYLILSLGSWDEYPYKRLLELLPDRADVCFAGELTSGQQADSGIRPVPLADLNNMDASEFTMLVSSPYWLPDVLALQPAYMVALLAPCPEGEDKALWDKYSGLLAARADLVGTASERLYLEQNLSKSEVVYLSGDYPLSCGLIRRGERLFFLSDYEAIWTRALTELWQPSSSKTGSWLILQRRLRADFYVSMCGKMPAQPTVHYLAATYLYLLGDEAAGRYLAKSFELMLLHDYTDCLHSHYRFFSAIEAKKGNLALAAAQYEITAFTEEERQAAAQMRQWLDNGQYELLQAEIYRVNEDIAEAIRILEKASCPEAQPLLLQNYITSFQWEKALQLQRATGLGVSEAAGPPSFAGAALTSVTVGGSGIPSYGGVQLPVIEGTLHLLHGRRHAAIRSFLRAAGAGGEARALFAEMADLEEAAGRLKGENR
ncbi:hypothetical protein [Paenibacillus sp. S150]|uniref:hypothetical protein n=1 Tax=Paenibacillus sp. S150 TaxID=2749826 RepID=UPI001C58D708|nr:hypothetical protein [Paenibacillus sp. S150]MBW4085581.1 hypothetical protein [Paenibacillus sp. S150]